MVLKREVIDLDLTIDQAIQYIVSCGLVIPPQELERTWPATARRARQQFRASRSQRENGPADQARFGRRCCLAAW